MKSKKKRQTTENDCFVVFPADVLSSVVGTLLFEPPPPDEGEFDVPDGEPEGEDAALHWLAGGVLTLQAVGRAIA